MRVEAGRSGRAWAKLRARVYDEETHCWLCGRYVDQTLPPQHPMARTADHVIPLSLGGDPLDRSTLRLAHRSCNSRRGASMPRRSSVVGASRRW